MNVNGESEEEEEEVDTEVEEDVGRRTKRRKIISSDEEEGEQAGPSRKLRKRPQKKKEGDKAFELLLDGVTCVLSGFVNPERADLRDKGLELGAKFEAEWNNECTHLVCAVKDTPKYKEVLDSNKAEGKDAKIVKSSWILDCHKKRRRLPWRRYCLNSDEEGPTSEEEVFAKREQSDSEFSQESELVKKEEKDPEFELSQPQSLSSNSAEDLSGKKTKKRKRISPERISSRLKKNYKEPKYKEDSSDFDEEEENYRYEEKPKKKSAQNKNKAPKEKKVVPRNNIYCQRCKDVSQHEMLACESCSYSYHTYCLIPKLKEIPEGEWHCPRCSTPEFEHKLEDILSWRWKEEEGVERLREFFIKWKDRSFWECSWVDHTPLDVHYKRRLDTYFGKEDMEFPPNLEDDDEYVRLFLKKGKHQNEESKDELNRHSRFYRYGVRPEWLQIHRIIQHQSMFGQVEYLVRWKDIPCDGATWMKEENEFKIPEFEMHIEIYKEYRFALTGEGNFDEDNPNFKHFNPPPRKASTSLNVQYKEQPSYINENLSIHPYQLSGLNWLRHSYTQGTNTILADEMGLGKTIQAITFLYSLYKEGHSNGPFLVSAPLSTILNWEREFEIWAPDFYIVTYCGKKEARESTRKYELTMKRDLETKGRRKFHVLLTSYEYISKDKSFLSGVKWAMLVVDEAQRLKSQKSLFFQVLIAYDIGYRLLLTGTPLQNNLEELFNLLHFLSPKKFNDLEEFQEKFADITKEEQVRQLHDMLGPRILRRMKSDVFKDLPSKSELIVRVELSPVQKKCYKDIITRNFSALNSNNGGGYFTSLMNIFMDLRKCCNHPYLFSAFETDAPKRDGGYELEALVQASGKLILLQKMLRKLKEGGHRVLIFSQMTRMLNILEDFLDAEGHRYERIDGSIGGRARQEAIDRFNSPGAEQFIFLLSTRAGGLGINLATADTVIIFDSDWNPHNDIQALSRAHRIGQLKKVMIYRFVTRATAEERIAQVAKKKLLLEQLVVRAQSFTKTEIDDVLKFGTRELFEESDDKKEVIHYTDEAIEMLLDRNQESTDPDSEQKENWANDYLSSFKVASYATVENNLNTSASTATLSKEDPFYWNKLMKVTGTHVEDERKKNEANIPILGKRIRKAVVYSEDKIKKEQDSLPKGSKSKRRREKETSIFFTDSSGDVPDKNDPDVNLDQLKDSESEHSDAEEDQDQNEEAVILLYEAEVNERLSKYWIVEKNLPDISLMNDGQVSCLSRCTLCNIVITRIGNQRPQALMNHMKLKHKPEYTLIKGIKEKKKNVVAPKIIIDLDMTLPYFDIIRTKQETSITCKICGEARKSHGKRGKDFRLKHLELIHPDKFKKIEESRMAMTMLQNMQAGSSSSAIQLNTLNSSFQNRTLQQHDNYITIFRYIRDVDKSQCEICGFCVKGRSVLKQSKHFNTIHNDFLLPTASTLLNGGDEDTSSEMSDLDNLEGVIKPEQGRNRGGTKASNLPLIPQLPDRINDLFFYLPEEDSSVCHLCGTKVPGNGRDNRLKHFNQKHKLPQPERDGEVMEVSSESETDPPKLKNALADSSSEEDERPLILRKTLTPRGPYKKKNDKVLSSTQSVKPTLSNNLSSSQRPLLPSDDPSSIFTYIKKEDKSQCQICGQKVKGDGSRNRRSHFNFRHKQQRDQLQLLNGEAIDVDSSESEEEGILSNDIKPQDFDSDVVEVSDDSDDEDPLKENKERLVDKVARTKKTKSVFQGREVTSQDTFLSVYTLNIGMNGNRCQLCGKSVNGVNNKSMKNRINHIQKDHPAAYNLIMEANPDEEQVEEVLQDILD